MHYLHLGDQQIHYVIDQSSSLSVAEGSLPFQHWQWDIHRDQPIPLLLQKIAETVPHPSQTPLHVVVNGSATLIPMANFDEGHCKAHLEKLLPQSAESIDRRVFYDVIPASNAILVFGISETICSAFERLWHNVYYISAQTGLLRRVSALQEHQQEQRCFIHLRPQAIDVACFQGKQLLGYNSFPAIQTADIIYYACQLASTLGCSPANTPFYICGETAQCESLAQSLSDYISHIEILEPKVEFAHHPLTTLSQLPFEFITHILSV